jgi:fimbrial chaperone protein
VKGTLCPLFLFPLSLVALALAGAGLAVPAAQAQTETSARRGERRVSLGSTRVIYPQGNNQVSLAVNNTDPKATFLIQSWGKTPAKAKAAILSSPRRCL